MAGCHVKAGHRERRACGGTTLLRPNRKTLEGGTHDHRVRSWDERSWSHVQRESGLNLSVFADANNTETADDRRSVSGVAVTLGNSGLSWISSTQKIVTLLTAEAEYVALGDEVEEALFSKSVLSSIVPSLSESCIEVYVDNEGAIARANDCLLYTSPSPRD